MKVLRYTFDICIRNGVDKDAYCMGSLIEKAIMKCDGVCGCEFLVAGNTTADRAEPIAKHVKEGGDHA